ncbi:MAG: alpha/beta fold hydrolase [Alphaproteobacteria bacterium]
MRILTLAGWGQPPEHVYLPGLDVTPFTYANDNLEAALEKLSKQAAQHDAIIGWSLGGQLAAMATARGMMRPQKLVMIASPFQFVHSEILPLGMPRTQFNLFRNNYLADPSRTLHKAWELVIKGDAKAGLLRQTHLAAGKDEMLVQPWHNWLHQLDDLTCHGLDFTHFPQTLLLHGRNDVVVKPNQSEHYLKHLPDAMLVVFDEAGHAPHWHDSARAQNEIQEFLHV